MSPTEQTNLQSVTPQKLQAKAYLVGAGPGDPELMTLKAKRILETADVVLYDYLVDSRIMNWVRADVELIYVGKSGLTGHQMTQEQIEALMVEKCREAKSVCRLKGGDPYLFGRGAEEAETLHAHGIPFEVVPGITSAIAAPAYAGIPVTHREAASAVSIITGHEDPEKPESMLDWRALANMPGTLVFLMGVKQLPHILDRLKTYGKSEDTPIALVHWGTRPEQKTITGTFETIEAELQRTGLKPPCIIVIGEVVNRRAALNWFETLALFGKTIAITRARKQASGLRQTLEQLGARVIEFPTIEIIPPEKWESVDSAISQISSYDWIVLTSPNGVDAFFTRLLASGLDTRSLSHLKIAAIGPATAAGLSAYGLKADLIPEQFVAEAIYGALKTVESTLSGKRFLLPRADLARDELVSLLESSGALVNNVVVYQTIMAQSGADVDALVALLADGKVDAITFSSSSTAANFAERLKPALLQNPSLLNQTLLASIGPITSQTMQDVLGRVDMEADVYTIPGLVDCLIRHFEKTVEVTNETLPL